MHKTINYRGHIIELDGIVARLYFQDRFVYKTSALNLSKAVMVLKAIVNDRLEMGKGKLVIDIYA